jgi:hypothetical protein
MVLIAVLCPYCQSDQIIGSEYDWNGYSGSVRSAVSKDPFLHTARCHRT